MKKSWKLLLWIIAGVVLIIGVWIAFNKPINEALPSIIKFIVPSPVFGFSISFVSS
jgi:hypothetical protein